MPKSTLILTFRLFLGLPKVCAPSSLFKSMYIDNFTMLKTGYMCNPL